MDAACWWPKLRPSTLTWSPRTDAHTKKRFDLLLLEEKNAQNRFSMRPTNAKRVLATGNFDTESRREILGSDQLRFLFKIGHVKHNSAYSTANVLSRSGSRCAMLSATVSCVSLPSHREFCALPSQGAYACAYPCLTR